jgi:hypothetical protein
MKIIIFLPLIFALFVSMNAQDKYISKTGHVWFYSKTPLETIEAHNNQVATVINVKNGSIAFNILNKSFKFAKALMEEHFNENYMQSEKYPKSTFSGTIIDFDYYNFRKNGVYKVTVEGDMTIHGVKKHIKEKGNLEIKNGKISVKTKFNIKPEDYNIQIPSLVRDKIASNLETSVEITYEPMK